MSDFDDDDDEDDIYVPNAPSLVEKKLILRRGMRFYFRIVKLIFLLTDDTFGPLFS